MNHLILYCIFRRLDLVHYYLIYLFVLNISELLFTVFKIALAKINITNLVYIVSFQHANKCLQLRYLQQDKICPEL